MALRPTEVPPSPKPERHRLDAYQQQAPPDVLRRGCDSIVIEQAPTAAVVSGIVGLVALLGSSFAWAAARKTSGGSRMN